MIFRVSPSGDNRFPSNTIWEFCYGYIRNGHTRKTRALVHFSRIMVPPVTTGLHCQGTFILGFQSAKRAFTESGRDFAFVSRFVSRASKNEAKRVPLGVDRKFLPGRKSFSVQVVPLDSEQFAQIYSLPPLATWVTYRPGASSTRAEHEPNKCQSSLLTLLWSFGNSKGCHASSGWSIRGRFIM